VQRARHSPNTISALFHGQALGIPQKFSGFHQQSSDRYGIFVSQLIAYTILVLMASDLIRYRTTRRLSLLGQKMITLSGLLYSIQRYVIIFVSDLRKIGDFVRVLRFPLPLKLTAAI
jgi:hypothetical protein